jgi:hypothetical protein
VPLSREAGLAGGTITYATVAISPSFAEMVAVFSVRWAKFRTSFQMPAVKTASRAPRGIAEYVALTRKENRSASALEVTPVASDPVSTASTEFDHGG